MKQDKLINTVDFHKAKCQGNQLLPRAKGVIDLRVHWIPGHKDFAPNEKADEMAKRATKGESSPNASLPKLLRHLLPFSIAMIKQDLKANVQNRWQQRWKMSPHYLKTRSVNKSTPSKSWLKLVTNLS